MRATLRVDELARGFGTSDAVRVTDKPAPTLASQGIDKNLAHQARSLGAERGLIINPRSRVLVSIKISPIA
jgi:hypothetical protein